MLQAVMKPNERKARPTCKRAAKAKPRNPATEVWEVSDGEITPSWGPNEQTSYRRLLVCYNLHVLALLRKHA